MDIKNVLKQLGITENNSGTSTGHQWMESGAKVIVSSSPVDGKEIGKVSTTTAEDYEKIISTSAEAFLFWRNVPAPKRGEIVRQLGEALREHKKPGYPGFL